MRVDPRERGKGGPEDEAIYTCMCTGLWLPSLQALALIELHKAPKGLYKNQVYLLPKKMGECMHKKYSAHVSMHISLHTTTHCLHTNKGKYIYIISS